MSSTKSHLWLPGLVGQLLCLALGCASSQPAGGFAPDTKNDVLPEQVAPAAPQKAKHEVIKQLEAPPDPQDIQRAQKLVNRGREAYRQGDYATAERILKEAILIYPFLPDANLALGKILLIRGSAQRDQAMLNSARLMFEMAAALDPQAHEAALLLELFHASQK